MFMRVIQIASVSAFLRSTLGSTVPESKSGRKDLTIAFMKGEVAETSPRPEEVESVDKPESERILAFFEGAQGGRQVGGVRSPSTGRRWCYPFLLVRIRQHRSTPVSG